MRKFLFLLGILLSTQAFSQASATAVVNTFVNVVEPIKITKSVDLNFGNVISGYNPGTLTLAPDGTRVANGLQLSSAVQGHVSPAEAIVSHGNNNYSITLPTTFTLFNLENPNQIILIDQFTVEPLINSGTEGVDILKIGATLNLDANQNPGVYTNSAGFNVTVTYN